MYGFTKLTKADILMMYDINKCHTNSIFAPLNMSVAPLNNSLSSPGKFLRTGCMFMWYMYVHTYTSVRGVGVGVSVWEEALVLPLSQELAWEVWAREAYSLPMDDTV